MTLGCARNEVDSEELAGRLTADGWELTEDDDAADVVLVNTCAFVASAKKDSIDTLLAAADGDRKVVAVGCLAERYGAELAESLPEASAVLGFDTGGLNLNFLNELKRNVGFGIAPRDVLGVLTLHQISVLGI